VAPYLLPGSLKTLRKSEPSLKIAPTSGRTDSLVAKLRDGSIDAVVLASPVLAGYQSYALGRDEFKLLTNSSLSDKVSISHLKESSIDVILLEDGHCLRTQAINACKVATGGLAGGVIDGGSLDMVVEMVASGLGATLVPQIAVQGLQNRKDLRVSDMTPEERAGRDLIVVWRSGHRREQEIVKVAEALRGQFRKLAKS
jgi:LysR family hydrogen peroxide-inducible transcriptional activator